MNPRTLRLLLGALVAGFAAALWITLDGCTQGTTPDCSGNPSPCGYPQAAEADAADQGG